MRTQVKSVHDFKCGQQSFEICTYLGEPNRRVDEDQARHMHREVELECLEESEGVLRLEVVPCPTMHVAPHCHPPLLCVCDVEPTAVKPRTKRWGSAAHLWEKTAFKLFVKSNCSHPRNVFTLKGRYLA